jgi:hypothetical protein
MDQIVLNAGYVLLVTAAFTRTLGRLRLLLIGASIALGAYGAVVGVWSMVVWNLIIGGIHAFRLARDAIATRAIALTDDERAIRDQYLPGCTDFNFNTLWGMGVTVNHDGTTVIAADSQPDSVSMVLVGEAVISDDGAEVGRVRPGGLLGEMSYVSGDRATVDVVADGALTVRQWDQRHLRALEQAHPPAAKAFDQLVAKDLAAKARA